MSRAGVGEDRPINIDGWNRATAVIPLLDTQRSILVRFDVNFSIGDIVLIQEPLGDAAVASPWGRIDRHRCRHTLASCFIGRHTGVSL